MDSTQTGGYSIWTQLADCRFRRRWQSGYFLRRAASGRRYSLIGGLHLPWRRPRKLQEDGCRGRARLSRVQSGRSRRRRPSGHRLQALQLWDAQGRHLHEPGSERDRKMITRRGAMTGLLATSLGPAVLGMRDARRINAGLELYSLRDDMKRDVPGTLKRVRQMGFDHVEAPGLYGLSAASFRRALDDAGLKATAFVAPYDQLKNDLAGVQANLKTLGARWALLPWINHGDKFERADAERAAKDMNSWSKALNAAGYRFAYHVHGYEFQPSDEGTLLDLMAQTTDTETVKFQLDTFW